ncbi:MAG: transporter substrate-binding domain-containing protein [Alphaproteobacteria bacterium]|nr:transporter substrate-binding domain-containing protein [Alphaproteobacteria bacterium]
MKSLVCVSLSLAMLCFSPVAMADTISIRGDAWCPYNCEPTDAAPGYMIEVAKEVFEKAGHKVDYQTLTWARALEKVKAGEFTAAVGAAQDDAPELVYGKNALGNSSNTFAVRADDPFVYKDISSLNGKALGTINGYAYTDVIDKYIEDNKADPKKIQAAAGDDAIKTNFTKLVAKRIDLIVDDGNVLASQVALQHLEGKVKVIESPLPSVDVYIAFSPANPKSTEYVTLLDKGIDDLRASGQLAKILAKYGVKDWK